MGLGTSLVSHMQFALTVMGLDEEERREIVGEMGGGQHRLLVVQLYTEGAGEKSRKANERTNEVTNKAPSTADTGSRFQLRASLVGLRSRPLLAHLDRSLHPTNQPTPSPPTTPFGVIVAQSHVLRGLFLASSCSVCLFV